MPGAPTLGPSHQLAPSRMLFPQLPIWLNVAFFFYSSNHIHLVGLSPTISLLTEICPVFQFPPPCTSLPFTIFYKLVSFFSYTTYLLYFVSSLIYHSGSLLSPATKEGALGQVNFDLFTDLSPAPKTMLSSLPLSVG